MRCARRMGWVLGALLLVLGGCSLAPVFRSPGVYHTIRPGETVYRIARTYGVELDVLVKANHIVDARRIVAGTRLYVPGASRRLRVPPIRRGTSGRSRLAKIPPWPGRKREVQRPAAKPAPPRKSAPRRERVGKVSLPAEVDFVWPLKGKVTSFFGRRGKRKHQGVDIAAPRGTPIRAAEAGVVIFSDNGPGGYGRMVILRHPNGFHTIYAHNSKNLAEKGRRVRQGEGIAQVGSTGRATGPHLHFEIRNRTQAKDPLFYLP